MCLCLLIHAHVFYSHSNVFVKSSRVCVSVRLCVCVCVCVWTEAGPLCSLLKGSYSLSSSSSTPAAAWQFTASDAPADPHPAPVSSPDPLSHAGAWVLLEACCLEKHFAAKSHSRKVAMCAWEPCIRPQHGRSNICVYVYIWVCSCSTPCKQWTIYNNTQIRKKYPTTSTKSLMHNLHQAEMHFYSYATKLMYTLKTRLLE